ncbi:hypothetical protein CMQ_4523 [Grosmannia clavigera kw1407]|uniref:MICOS complex subunit MIC60 n=1 Tax=Grosmannia clavigera (strain kw1407 / UAMH 11150) TaxID=655863 RepID=F0XU33_GROCL|nr:uncharacterized protein CMQ_4523 [Grosmannia clavigera kw1407]EFW98671.1 hypothetical protein CMQ_4523 [Grosmannia clavigera kw1407]
MLRTSIRSAQSLRSRTLLAAAAAPAAAGRTVSISSKRLYATDPKVTPAIHATTTTTVPPPPAATMAAAAAVAPRKGGFFRKLRNYVLTLSILGALGFGGGVWCSRINDNFHDFFTEYVPYGEQAVLYLEELEFQKRVPTMAQRLGGQQPRDTGSNVRVPAQSGASWRVADSESSRQTGSTAAVAAAAPAPAAAPSTKAEARVISVKPAKDEDVIANVLAKQAASKTAAAAEAAVVRSTDKAKAKKTTTLGYRAPEVDEPSRWPPASPIDPLAVRDATEPVVQDIVHVLNDIITVINADRAADRYGATIGKAKAEVDRIGGKIQAIRAGAEQAAAQQVRARTDGFEKAARELVSRVERAMVAQEAQWRQTVDVELARVRGSYEERLALATARERQLSEERLQNELLEQAVQLTGQFAEELRTRVEAERDGRLGRLRALSDDVAGLERLTAGWTAVVDASERAQQLHVAVDAVRARLSDESATKATTEPFVRELVAVKEIAGGDAAVDAAIASIPPAAYQRGIPSAPAIIDRFRRVAAEVRKAALLPEDAGVASHASSYILSKVLFKRQPAVAPQPVPSATTAAGGGTPTADDVEGILARTQALLEEGNLDGAAREVNGLQGWAKTLSRDWLAEVRKVLEVQQAVDVISAEARLRSLQLEKSHAK